jgi:hypothetical protein
MQTQPNKCRFAAGNTSNVRNIGRIVLLSIPVAVFLSMYLTSLQADILNLAEIVVAEVEPNALGEIQDLDEQFAQTMAVGIEGGLSDPNDEDAYQFSLGQQWGMELLFEIQGAEDKAITAITSDRNSQIYFVSENSIWRYVPQGQSGTVELVVPSRTLAEFLGLDAEVLLQVDAVAGVTDPNTEDVLLIAMGGDETKGGGNVLALDSNEDLVVIASREDIIALTGQTQVNFRMAADEKGRIYLSDRVSGSVLQIEREPGVEPASYLVSVYTSAAVLQDAIETDVFEDLSREITTVPRTVISQTTGAFVVNSLVLGSGDYVVPGRDTYYLGQLSPLFGGSGGITRITVNQLNMADVTGEEFFTPEPNDLNALNPSALALDTSAGSTFGSLLYLGTFGPSLGDDFDGRVYVVDETGQISPYVTAYEDGGETAMKGGQEVTGFFDVVDMAFPPTMNGPFGPYLYVLSENIDQNGTTAGGFSSDVWRIDQEGVAELFVEAITDGVISLAFGNFAYGNDLYVATFNSGISEGKVLRVDSNGDVETFFDFSQFGSSISVCDLAFAPVALPGNSPMAGALVLTMKSGTSTFVIQLEPDGMTYQVWATDLQTGDVSSGDLIFDNSGHLIIAQQASKNLIRLEYLGLFDYSLEQLQVRPMLEEIGQELTFAPYALVQVADQPRILRLSDSGDSGDIITEVNPSVLDDGEAPIDGSMNVSFAFDAVGDLFTYIQNADELRASQRNQDGNFTQFTPLLTGAEIDGMTGLQDAHLPQLAWSANGNLVAIGRNGVEAPAGQGPPSQEFDDVVLWLGNTIDQTFEPNAVVQVSDLTQMKVELTGPGEFHEFTATAGSVLDEVLEELNGGSYTLSVRSIQDSRGEYQVVIILDNTIPGTLVCDESTGPRQLTKRNGERLLLDHDGPGQSELQFQQEPNGVVVELTSLTITGSNGSTSVSLVNLDDPEDMLLGEVVLHGSLERLEYRGTLDLLRGAEFTKGTVKNVNLGTVSDVYATKYSFPEFRVTNLGDPETQGHQFWAKRLTSLIVENNVEHIFVMENDSRNAYRLIEIGGIVNDGIFLGQSISECIVRNAQGEEIAMNESYLSCTVSGGSIGEVRVEQGSVFRTGIFSDKSIKLIELMKGNLDTSTVEAAGRNSGVDTVIVKRDKAQSDPNESGNILSSRIAATRRVSRIHADGNITGTSIVASGSIRARIDSVTCGRDCTASLTAMRIKEILTGFDENKQKIPEVGEFTGGNFRGSVSVTVGLDLLSATGRIENAFIGANRTFGYGSIKSIFAEDGFVNSSLSFLKKTTRIMVGYEDGKRNRIVNTAADVSGSISGPRLGRLYYTGENSVNISTKYVGPVIDDVP